MKIPLNYEYMPIISIIFAQIERKTAAFEERKDNGRMLAYNPFLRHILRQSLNIVSFLFLYDRAMSREKIRVPQKVYDELTALKREIHFTLDHTDTIKKAEDRGYLAAADWIRRNENAYKVGFSWGFEPEPEAPRGMIQDIPEKAEPAPQRTFRSRGSDQTMKPRSQKKAPEGFCAKVKNWLDKYF